MRRSTRRSSEKLSTIRAFWKSSFASGHCNLPASPPPPWTEKDRKSNGGRELGKDGLAQLRPPWARVDAGPGGEEELLLVPTTISFPSQCARSGGEGRAGLGEAEELGKVGPGVPTRTRRRPLEAPPRGPGHLLPRQPWCEGWGGGGGRAADEGEGVVGGEAADGGAGGAVPVFPHPRPAAPPHIPQPKPKLVPSSSKGPIRQHNQTIPAVTFTNASAVITGRTICGHSGGSYGA